MHGPLAVTNILGCIGYIAVHPHGTFNGCVVPPVWTGVGFDCA